MCFYIYKYILNKYDTYNILNTSNYSYYGFSKAT